MEPSEKFALFLYLVLVGLVVLTYPRASHGDLDAAGFTILKREPTTRSYYVSAAGDDATAIPDNEALAYQTIGAALAAAREGFPDWILLRRGDTWREPGRIDLRSGHTYANYGEGARPILEAGPEDQGARYCCSDYTNIKIVGIDFYSYSRDPAHPEYAGGGGNKPGIVLGAFESGGPLLIEDCIIRFFDTAISLQSFNDLWVVHDVVIRRNMLLDSYSDSSHSQGMYSKNISALIEENLFDHNGWFAQAPGTPGKATIFNHNIYTVNARGFTMRRNLFLNSSSIGTKWTANNGEASAQRIRMLDNLIVHGEVGISMGGNQSEPPFRWLDVLVRHNVLVNIGHTQPTNRNLGWYLEANDWDDGEMRENLLIHGAHPTLRNLFPISVKGQTRNTIVADNDVFGHPEAFEIYPDSTLTNVTFEGNSVDPAQPADVFGLIGTTADEISERARARAPGVWDDEWNAAALNAKLRAAFGVSYAPEKARLP